MHKCTSTIINSFHLFQKTLFNKEFQGFPIVGGGHSPPIQQFFLKTPVSKPTLPMGHPLTLKNEAHPI